MNKKNLSALIGLCGAISNNGKTENTDDIVREVLLSTSDLDLTDRIHQEKFKISPNCETCASPCGNTSDYPLEAFDSWPKEQRFLKEQVLDEAARIAKEASQKDALPDILYRAISYIGYDLVESSYKKLLEEMRTW